MNSRAHVDGTELDNGDSAYSLPKKRIGDKIKLNGQPLKANKRL